MSSLGGDDVSQLVADVMGDGMLLPGAPPSTTGTPTVRVTPSPNAQVTIPVTSLAGSPSSRNLAAPSLRGTQHDTQTPSMDTSSGCGVGAGAEAAAVGSRAGARSSAVGPLHSARHIASVAQTHSLVRRRSSRSPHSGYVKTSARRRAMLEVLLDVGIVKVYCNHGVVARIWTPQCSKTSHHRTYGDCFVYLIATMTSV